MCHSAVISVQFDPTEYSVAENDGSVRLRLVADQAALESYSVLVTFTDSDATCKYIYTCHDCILFNCNK